ncbi:cohesin domain-containing protein [Georgenia faecalis]|uniref:Cohesin domain-containing protein n=1 Tax=Georgenia faecalis TaxID=2483799 RepID=A0ABV9D8R3_9MICO|nr:cohesin domain-containing protein [Georgenia faecalis]
MRPPRLPALAAGALGTGLLVLGATPALAAPATSEVTLTAPGPVAVGEPLTLEIDLADTVDVYAYELAVAFDGAALAYVAESATGPAGGFDAAEPEPAGVTLVHSRLGTSPALDGDLAATLEVSALAAGTSTVDVAVTLVGADGSVSTETASAVVEVTAAPTPDPTPEPTAEPTPDPTTPDPTPAPTTAPSAPTPTSPAPGPTAAPVVPPAGGSLPSTGVPVAGAGLLAAAAVALGALGARGAHLRKAGAR